MQVFHRDVHEVRIYSLCDTFLCHFQSNILGISVSKRRLEIIIGSAFITGIAVSLTGIIAFVGLIVPHLVRMTIGSRHNAVLPCSMICGAILLLIADWFSRWVFAPIEIPVGIVMTLLGAPLFVALIAKWTRGITL